MILKPRKNALDIFPMTDHEIEEWLKKTGAMRDNCFTDRYCVNLAVYSFP
jgi:hypothetical protein